MKRLRYGLYVFLVLLLGIVVSLWYVGNKEYSVTTLKSQNGYIFAIQVPYLWEITRPVLCQGVKDKKTLFKKRIGIAAIDPGKMKFKLIETEDDLVVITEQTNPYVALMIVDLKHLKSDPLSPGWLYPSSTGWPKQQIIAQKLIQRLNRNAKDEPFVLDPDPVIGMKKKSPDYSEKIENFHD